jgi:hypothetical protein
MVALVRERDVLPRESLDLCDRVMRPQLEISVSAESAAHVQGLFPYRLTP